MGKGDYLGGSTVINPWVELSEKERWQKARYLARRMKKHLEDTKESAVIRRSRFESGEEFKKRLDTDWVLIKRTEGK